MKLRFEAEAHSYVVEALIAAGAVNITTSRDLASGEYEISFEGLSEEEARQTIRRALTEFRFREADEWDPDKLRQWTKQDIIDYINTNVTDLHSAKAFITRLALLVRYLYRKIELEE